jgi:very-short-patch-repair endonuclease
VTRGHPSPTGRGAGGEGGGEGHHGPPKLPEELLQFARDLRKRRTDAGTRLWLLPRARRLGGKKFRRQHPTRPYVVDFYCDEARLVIELDGSQHAEAAALDARRTRFLQSRGLTVLRFRNNAVLRETEAVTESISAALYAPSPGAPRAPPSPRGRE